MLSLKPRPANVPAQKLAIEPEFWFIWNPARMRPKKRHSSLDHAKAELARLRTAFPAETFDLYEAHRCDEAV